MKVLNAVASPYLPKVEEGGCHLSVFEQAKQMPPILSASRSFGHNYPRAMMRTLQDLLLRTGNIQLDEAYFHPISVRLESTLEHLEIDCTRERFWQGIRNARSELYRASESTYGDFQMKDRGTMLPWHWHWTPPVTPITNGSPDGVVTLQTLSAQAVVQAMPGADELGPEIVNQHAELIFFLMHQRVSEVTAAARQCRPELWESKEPVCPAARESLAEVEALLGRMQDSRNWDIANLLKIDGDLTWASYHAGFTDLDLSNLPNDSEIAIMTAVETVRFRLAQILNTM